MNTNTQSQSPTTSTSQSTVVVGVDGSSRNRSAVAWAKHEATRKGGSARAGRCEPGLLPTDSAVLRGLRGRVFEDNTRKVLEGVRADLGGAAEEMPIWVGRGDVQSTMLRAAERADLVVLGRRGSGAVKRMFVGSNSIAVAGRSPVPVVIVPDEWDGRGELHGADRRRVDRSAKDEEALTYAFARARDLGVPLIVVHTWQLPTIYVWSADDVKEWMDEVTEELKAALEPWKGKYPEVDTMLLPRDANAAMAIADAAAIAQLVVLGRRTGPRHLGGFHHRLDHTVGPPPRTLPSGRHPDVGRRTSTPWSTAPTRRNA